MLCTNCSTKVRPIVAIDIDGTLGDYHGHFLEFAQKYLGVKPGPAVPMFAGKGGFKEWFMFAFQADERTWNDIKLAYRQGGMKRSMPARTDYGAPLEIAEQFDAEIWITTTRPYLRLDGIDPDTRFWLDYYKINYDGLLYDQDKYEVLAARVDAERVVAVLDDLPEQYDAAEQAFGSSAPILCKGLYNENVHRCNEAVSLLHAAIKIQERLELWQAQAK